MAAWSGVLDVGEHRLAVDLRGDPPSLLLLNGVGGGHGLWGPLRRAFPADLGTVTFDAPGCGASPAAGRPLSVSHQARLAAGVARELGLERLDVLGFSFGGMVAQQLAHDRPDLVRRLVLVSTGFGVGSWPGNPVALTLLALPHLVSSPATETLSPYVFGGRVLDDAGRAARRHALAAPVDMASYAGQLVAGASWSSLPWLACLRQRTLLVAGDDDPLVPVGNATVMAALLRRSRLHRVSRGGHLVLVDQAREVADAVAEFLASP